MQKLPHSLQRRYLANTMYSMNSQQATVRLSAGYLFAAEKRINLDHTEFSRLTAKQTVLLEFA